MYSKSTKKFLGCRDPRWKHEYLDSGQIWVTITEEENGDESDKHIQARDRRYSCLINTKR